MQRVDWRLRILSVIAAACAMSGSVAGAAEVKRVKPDGNVWEAARPFSFQRKNKKTRQSLSGIACSIDTPNGRACLVVFDEGIEARYVFLQNDGYAIDNERIKLLDRSGELDAEGAATDGKHFYVTGSHSMKRTGCERNPASRHVIRFAVDPATGKARRESDGALAGYAETGALWSVMSELPALKGFVGKCLGAEHGVNIEGLAIRDGELYFGFREPARNETAKILRVNADALFTTASPPAVVTTIKVGGGRGIRDLQVVKDGLLLLVGPDDEEDNDDKEWSVLFWDGRSTDQTVVPKELAILDLSGVELRSCDEDLKPEAFAVLEDTPALYRLVVLSDGMCDGGPLAFRIAR